MNKLICMLLGHLWRLRMGADGWDHVCMRCKEQEEYRWYAERG